MLLYYTRATLVWNRYESKTIAWCTCCCSGGVIKVFNKRECSDYAEKV